MSNIAMQGGATGTGTVSLVAPSTSTNRTLTLPDATGTVMLNATQSVPRTALPAGSVLQVVSVNTTLAFSTTSGTFSSVGLTASITPTSATSKILIITQYPFSTQSSNMTLATALYRGGSAVLTFNTHYAAAAGYLQTTPSMNYLDSPATTSSTTYTIYARVAAGAGTISADQSSVITLMEIAA